MAHIAGGARLDVNERWATPTGLGTYNATAFPFADAAQKDPVSGVADGLLDNPRARQNQPKIFYTNTGVEYWGGGRSAALDSHGRRRRERHRRCPANVRDVLLRRQRSTDPQHFRRRRPGPAEGQSDRLLVEHACAGASSMEQVGARTGRCRRRASIRGCRTARWCKASTVAFPAIPGVQSPRALTAGVRMSTELAPGSAGAGAPLPFLVPQVDADGNERAGIRLPEVAVPLATYTGWNFRNEKIGGTPQLVSLLGSYIPLAQTKAERDAAHDPRPSIAERYMTKEQYLEKINRAAAALVKDGYLLADDVAPVVKRAADHWDYAHDGKN